LGVFVCGFVFRDVSPPERTRTEFLTWLHAITAVDNDFLLKDQGLAADECNKDFFKGGLWVIRGLYTAASGMLVESQRTDVISNNLANVDTPGYHRKTSNVRAFPDMLVARMHGQEKVNIGHMGTGAVVDGGEHSFRSGRLQSTGNPLDLALAGHGFFAVDAPGGTHYTKDGSFTRNQAGWLVTQAGQRVLGQNGPIHLGEGSVDVNADGDLFVDGRYVDSLLVVEFNDRSGLQRVGDNLYRAVAEAGDPMRYNGAVMQGAVEMSNVNVIREMVNMIEVHRSYEANQKVIQAHDETLGRAVNDIAG